MKINVKELIGSNIAISAEKGRVLRDDILNGLKKDLKVIVDFEGITDLTTAFLNTAIGQLYVDYSSEELNEKLELKQLDEMNMYLLTQVIKRAKMNEESRTGFHSLVREVLNDE